VPSADRRRRADGDQLDHRLTTLAQPIPPSLTTSARVEATAPAEWEAASLAEAKGVLDLVPADPRRALDLAEALLGQRGIGGETRAVTERAAALAELDLGRVVAARGRFERPETGHWPTA